jgi:hypothetical protein
VPEYLDPYRRAVEEIGTRFEALLWRSREFQERRFAVLLEAAACGLTPGGSPSGLASLEGRVIADLGCGRADLAIWIHGVGLRYGGYLGVEAIPELAEASRVRLRSERIPKAEVIEADFAADEGLFARLIREHGAELLLFSGSLNTFRQDGAERVITTAFDAMVPGGAVVFNFLSDRCAVPPSDDTGPARRFDTLAMLDLAATLTPRFVLRHDYLNGHDATIALFKD